MASSTAATSISKPVTTWVDSLCREHLWRTLCLIGLAPHLVAGHFLVVLLPEDRDNVERRTPG